MSAHDPYGFLGSIINKFKIDANLGNNTIAIANTTDNFEILTDKQALALMYAGQLATKFPSSSVNDMLHNTVPQLIRPDINPPANPTDARLLDNWAYGYLNLHPIRNLYLISNTLGTYNSMAVNGEWGILKKIPVSADYNQLIYDQTVLGMDYFDCSHVSFSIIFVKVADEW